MARVIRTVRAKADLKRIWIHVSSDSESAADPLVRSIDAACDRLAAFPELGPSRDDIRLGLRHLSVDQYLVFYRINGADVRIVRVLHGRRDLGGLL